MKAARLHAYGKPLVIEDVHGPEPRWGETVIRVERAGAINDVHDRLKRGAVRGRVVITP